MKISLLMLFAILPIDSLTPEQCKHLTVDEIQSLSPQVCRRMGTRCFQKISTDKLQYLGSTCLNNVPSRVWSMYKPRHYKYFRFNGFKRFEYLDGTAIDWDQVSDQTVKMNAEYFIVRNLVHLVENRIHLVLTTKRLFLKYTRRYSCKSLKTLIFPAAKYMKPDCVRQLNKRLVSQLDYDTINLLELSSEVASQLMFMRVLVGQERGEYLDVDEILDMVSPRKEDKHFEEHERSDSEAELRKRKEKRVKQTRKVKIVKIDNEKSKRKEKSKRNDKNSSHSSKKSSSSERNYKRYLKRKVSSSGKSSSSKKSSSSDNDDRPLYKERNNPQKSSKKSRNRTPVINALSLPNIHEKRAKINSESRTKTSPIGAIPKIVLIEPSSDG